MNTFGFRGKTVVLTRHSDNNAELATELTERGSVVVELPLISFEAPDDHGDALLGAVSNLGEHDWIAVLSPEGARRVISTLGQAPVAQVGVVGSGTARVLREAGWKVALVASESSAFGLAADLVAGFEPTPVVIAQSDIGRADLQEALASAGWSASSVVAYRNIEPTSPAGDVAEAVRQADVVVFASPSAVERFVRVCGTHPSRAVCFGRTTAVAASEAGFSAVVAGQPSLSGVLKALDEALA